jgi:tetratricopeptide (TPR) repeat protein
VPGVEPPEDVDPRELAPEVRSQLRTLSRLAADRVARHLVAAGRLVDEDPQAALEQARAARALGARVAVVREAVGETAYAAGEWAEAIAELRTARRMTGDDSALPLLADSERALGRPDRALRLARSPEAQRLPLATRVEMAIVEAGTRRDLGQVEAALVTLHGAGLGRRRIEPWSPRLWYAYADTLLAAGRTDEARDWFVAAASADAEGETDAAERVLELDGVEILDDEYDEYDEYEDDDDEDDDDEDDREADNEEAGEAPSGKAAEPQDDPDQSGSSA